MSLHHIQFFSDALQKHTACYVAYPDRVIPGPYHAMILMHGLSDDYTIWQRRTSIERYVQGLPLVVVMPDGGRGFYVDALQGYQYLQAIAYELPELVKHWFRVDGSWCTAGLSMGGYGALRVALERPELFVSAVSHSGALYVGHGYPSSSPEKNSKWDEEFLPIFGDVMPGGKNDLLALALNAEPLPKIRFDCGTEDFLLEANRWYDEVLTEKGIPHQYEEFPGDHNWEYWDQHIVEAIKFSLDNMQD